MTDLKANLDSRIERMGEGFGTNDPLLAEAVILIARTLVDISAVGKTVDGASRVHLEDKLDYGFRNVMYRYEKNLENIASSARDIGRTAEINGLNGNDRISELSYAIRWLSGGIAWLCLLGTILLLWAIFAG